MAGVTMPACGFVMMPELGYYLMTDAFVIRRYASL